MKSLRQKVTGIAGTRTNVEENEDLKNKLNRKIRSEKAFATVGLRKASKRETKGEPAAELPSKHTASGKEEHLITRLKA
ncbi:MAG TPA: hypothetical protein VE619_03830, partial [Nitrososphaeraceae archaeon]|nr:hypothetical protein [Nitrososphaeraceae archaeon]